jgi:hypothetical protein
VELRHITQVVVADLQVQDLKELGALAVVVQPCLVVLEVLTALQILAVVVELKITAVQRVAMAAVV